MNEAERLQKIVAAQEKEVRRLRKLLQQARVAQADYFVEDGALRIIVTAIGVDEYHFTEQTKPELTKIAEAILSQISSKVTVSEIRDEVTGEPAEGAVIPE